MTTAKSGIQEPPRSSTAGETEHWIDGQIRRIAQRAEVFERILHRSPGILLVMRTGANWPLEYVSTNVVRLGLDERTLQETNAGFLDLVHEDDRDRVAMETDYWVEHTTCDDFRVEFRCKDSADDVRWMDTHLWLRRDVHGNVRRMQGIAWDITERKRAERLQRLAISVVELLNCPDDISEIIHNILEMIRFYTQMQSAAIHLMDADGKFDCIESGYERRAPFDPEHCSLIANVIQTDGLNTRCTDCPMPTENDDLTPVGMTRTDGGTLWSCRMREMACARRPDSCVNLDRQGSPIGAPGSLGIIPLRAAGDVVGLLQVCDDRESQCDPETIEALEGLGFSIGIALDRERTTHRLGRSEERYRALFDTSLDGIAMLTLDHRVEAANHALETITGRTRFDIEDTSIWSLLHVGSLKTSDECIPGQLLGVGYSEEFERQVVRPNREKVRVMCRAWTVRDDSGRPKRTLVILRDIESQRRTEQQVTRLVTAIEQSAEIVVVTDFDSNIEYVNPTFEFRTGYTREEALGMSMAKMRDPDVSADEYEQLLDTIRSGEVFKGRVVQMAKDGSRIHVDQTVSPVRNETGEIMNFVAVQRDVTELMQLEAQLLQAQKLESIGRLAAGIAHEINTPAQYVGDNVRFLKDGFDDFMKVMTVGAELTEAAMRHPELKEQAAKVRETVECIDMEYLAEEIPRAVDQSLDGLRRISKIVGAMKYYSHPGASDIAPVDIHQAIESTVTVARNEWKYDAELELDFDPSMPPVPCLANELNQVVLNLVINAVHAIQVKRAEHGPKGHITVRTRVENSFACIEIEDSGTGIPDEIASKVFDPFFTTKDVGSGTGQGLSIARDVIVGKHKGEIDFRTTPGEGTTFALRLPLHHTKPPGPKPGASDS